MADEAHRRRPARRHTAQSRAARPRATSSSTRTRRSLLDLGQGSFAELWRYRSPATLAAVFISHMHADHNVDLVPLRHWVKFANRRQRPQLFGPTDLRPRYNAFQVDRGFLRRPGWRSARRRRDSPVGDLPFEAGRVTHIPDSFAFRVTSGDGPGLVYSGDCGVPDDLLPLVRPGTRSCARQVSARIEMRRRST